MAKRIIKNGKFNMITCSKCGCEFSFDTVDIEANGTVKCPQCFEENTPTLRESLIDEVDLEEPEISENNT